MFHCSSAFRVTDVYCNSNFSLFVFLRVIRDQVVTLPNTTRLQGHHMEVVPLVDSMVHLMVEPLQGNSMVEGLHMGLMVNLVQEHRTVGAKLQEVLMEAMDNPREDHIVNRHLQVRDMWFCFVLFWLSIILGLYNKKYYKCVCVFTEVPKSMFRHLCQTCIRIRKSFIAKCVYTHN